MESTLQKVGLARALFQAGPVLPQLFQEQPQVLPALPCHNRSSPALPCPALPCPALPCPALPCPLMPVSVHTKRGYAAA